MRVVLVGYGAVGRRHAEAISITPEVDLVAIVEPDTAVEVPSSTQRYTTLEPALRVTQPDLVVVATPPAVIADVVVNVARHAEYVLAEKPVALSTSQYDALLARLGAFGERVFVGFQTHFSRASLGLLAEAASLKQAVRVRGTVGLSWNRDLAYFRGWRDNDSTSGGPLLLHASHGLSLWSRLVPADDVPRRVSGYRLQARGENGLRGTELSGRVMYESGRELVISIRLDSRGPQTHWLLVEHDTGAHLVHGKNIGQTADGTSEDACRLRAQLFGAIADLHGAGVRHPALFSLADLRATLTVAEEVYGATSAADAPTSVLASA